MWTQRSRQLYPYAPVVYIYCSHGDNGAPQTTRRPVRPARLRRRGGVHGDTGGGGTVLLHRARRGLLTARAYGSFLRDRIPAGISSQAPTVLYSYSHAATGFAARLTVRQAARLASSPSVLAVVPDAMLELHTTLTPTFLGLSPSSGLSPGVKRRVRRRHRGNRHRRVPGGPRVLRRRPVAAAVAARQIPRRVRLRAVVQRLRALQQQARRRQVLPKGQESESPLDTSGHGTHTASTAAGSAAADAGFYGYARGKAVGMAPGARIAVYKACWEEGCPSSDTLAAFDEAIPDGVDVISASLSASGKAADFYADVIAVGAFRAVSKGIVVSASAGNSGPGEYTAANIAPWFLTVGASTLNRQFRADAVLGNGETFKALLSTRGATKMPLVYGADVGSKICEEGKLNASMVAGKIVVCDPGMFARAVKEQAVKLAGGAGAIFGSIESYGEQVMISANLIPATVVPFAASEKIKKYISTETNPTATIVFRGTVVGRRTPPSPRMASFSSRGPNVLAPEILKPDVSAPGVDILAAWTGANSPTGLASDTRRAQYNIVSGTSMSCPHVSGVAALLRQARPEWSPAAIKSALD